MSKASKQPKNQNDYITVKGAREHNLKNIDVSIPRDKLVVITGLSGSGKSSLAFDTIYAEGQRRYVESLSAYARQFLELTHKPECDSIDGLSPAISIDQKSTSRNPRSTVGTVTEISDYLRLLFAKIGIPHCPQCGGEVERQSISEMVDTILHKFKGKKIIILAPLVQDRKGEHRQVLEKIKADGFVRFRLDGAIYPISEEVEINPKKKHSLEAVVDRLEVKAPLAPKKLKNGTQIEVADPDRSRLAGSIELAAKLSEGLVSILVLDEGSRESGTSTLFSENFSCMKCDISLPEIAPRNFSFNSPHGACPECHGLGEKLEVDPVLAIANPRLSIEEGVIAPFASSGSGWYLHLLRGFGIEHGFSTDTPWQDIPQKTRDLIMYGDRKAKKRGAGQQVFDGVVPMLSRKYEEAESDAARDRILEYMRSFTCPACGGARLRPESLSVTVSDRNISEITNLSIAGFQEFFNSLKLTKSELHIAHLILREVIARSQFLINVGLSYLTLDRAANTLSGGEAQRIRLATQIGSYLRGVLYVLDEPSIGLHQRDNDRLIDTLVSLRDLGNTVIVVEHDEEMMRRSDYIFDIGPGAGIHGGEVVAEGTIEQIMKNKNSSTGQYLSGKKEIAIPKQRRSGNGKFLEIIGAEEHNLKNIDVSIPLGQFVGITGVSGSGKSTLIHEILVKYISSTLNRARKIPGKHREIRGIDHIDKLIAITQDPIGRTPRSNAATYTGVFTDIRDLFAGLPEAKLRGYKSGRFSFNVKGGRCEACSGDGTKKIEMHFLPDVYVECEVCHGARYNHEALEILYRGKTIADVLDMTVSEACEFFTNIPLIKQKLTTLEEVGLGYVKLGQSATTLSGGEAQRVKLATELSRRATGKTLYILDEPTTGLHFEDIQKLLRVLHTFADSGNTVLIIEHNLDVIKNCDHLIDIGPSGGDEGGEVVAEGTPEQVAQSKLGFTAEYLKRVLK